MMPGMLRPCSEIQSVDCRRSIQYSGSRELWAIATIQSDSFLITKGIW